MPWDIASEGFPAFETQYPDGKINNGGRGAAVEKCLEVVALICCADFNFAQSVAFGAFDID